MVDQLDMILTSAGPASNPLGYGLGKVFLEADDISHFGSDAAEGLQKLILGDISGVCIPHSDLNAEETERLGSINKRWTGVRFEHLKSCAERAVSGPEKKPGVVVVARGKAKASIVHELLKVGLINNLVIDLELEEELERQIG